MLYNWGTAIFSLSKMSSREINIVHQSHMPFKQPFLLRLIIATIDVAAMPSDVNIMHVGLMFLEVAPLLRFVFATRNVTMVPSDPDVVHEHLVLLKRVFLLRFVRAAGEVAGMPSYFFIASITLLLYNWGTALFSLAFDAGYLTTNDVIAIIVVSGRARKVTTIYEVRRGGVQILPDGFFKSDGSVIFTRQANGAGRRAQMMRGVI